MYTRVARKYFASQSSSRLTRLLLQTEPGYIDVSCRLVDATDAQNLTSTWEAIANQAVVSHTFVSTFNALLSNQGARLSGKSAGHTSAGSLAHPDGVQQVLIARIALDATLYGSMDMMRVALCCRCARECNSTIHQWRSNRCWCYCKFLLLQLSPWIYCSSGDFVWADWGNCVFGERGIVNGLLM